MEKPSTMMQKLRLKTVLETVARYRRFGSTVPRRWKHCSEASEARFQNAGTALTLRCSFIFALATVVFWSQNALAQTYKDKSATPEERAKSIVEAMTLDEKVSLMTHEAAAVPRLGIKQYNWWNEALHGVGRAGLATVFPQPIGMAATFDDELVLKAFDAVSTEARAKYNVARKKGPLHIYEGLTFWTPNINIFRDPRWGRGHETYGEDPFLTAIMGTNVVKGLQGPSDAPHRKLLACAKHFAVHSGPEWNRHQFNAEDIALRDLYETYLPAFQALVQKGDVQQVMCAYNRFEGDPCCGSNRLLQQILRNEWGYKGVVVSDCGAVADFFMKNSHHTDPDPKKATSRAVRTGTDLECGNAYPNLVEAVKEGLVSEEEINRSVTRLMKARYELGEMDDEDDCEWNRLPFSVVDSKEHKALALQMARESMTLLKNDNNILPLRTNMKIAVIGANANDSVMQWGNYNGFPSHTSTLVSALQQHLPASNIQFLEGFGLADVAKDGVIDLGQGRLIRLDSIVNSVKEADVIVFAGGISPRLEGEEMRVDNPGFRGGDREIIELPAVQTEFLTRLKRLGKPIVMVNYSGSAIALTKESALCDAILQAWYPGQAGGEAVVETLLGNNNPSGRLPVTFYASTAELPDFQDYSMQNRTYRYYKGTALYPFGYGLSYSTFRYGKAKISQKNQSLSVSIPVKNVSKIDGDEVVQVYLQRVGDSEGPSHALRGFKRVRIAAGKTKKVVIKLTPDELQWFDTQTNSMRIIPGEYAILYGPSSDMKTLHRVPFTMK